jgi:TonB-linked SusC/RagA family outer membrane protein
MQFSFAQEKTVTGVVSDKTGPLPGANVVVKGTSTSTQTDFDGKFSIKAKAGAVLEFSFTGYSNKSITVGAANSYNVVLSEGVELQEVVVVGYGTTTKERFTGTAAKVNIENIEAKTVSNVSQALRGEIAGVNVVTGSGAPGRDATIRIRGFGSVNGNRDPLYVVDGAPYPTDQFDLASINPADIESMTVLKDAAATSIYGNRGANGVIIITTKQGKIGKSVVSVDFKTSINSLMLPEYNRITSPEEYIETAWSSLRTKAYVNGEANPAAWASANLYGDGNGEGINSHYNIWNVAGPSLIDPITGKLANGVSRKYNPTKWSDAAFGTGYRSEANVQFSGGNEKTRFALSFGYLDDKGYTLNSGYTRYTARLNLEDKVKDWLKVSGNIGYTGAKYTNSTSDEENGTSSGNIFALINTTPAIYDIYLRDGSDNLVADPIFGGYQFDYGADPYARRAWNNTNAIADATYDLDQTLGTTLLGNFNVDIDLTKNLAFETRYSGQLQIDDAANRNNPYYGGWAESYGSLYKTHATTTNQNFLQLLRFNKSFGSHTVEAFVAHESTDWKSAGFSAAMSHSILPNTLDFSNYTTPIGTPFSSTQRYTLESYFAQLSYDYNKKYFLTASFRRDGSSRFKDNQWGNFGSVGLGWIVSKEDFMSKLSFVDYLKLKASYGIVADQGLDLQFGFQKKSIEIIPGNGALGNLYGTPTSTLRRNDLTWETSRIAQVGVESTFFKDVLDINIDYYVKNTNNLFFNQTLPPSSGFTAVQINSGAMRNSGLEFDVNAHVIKPKTADGFKLDLGVNGEILKNEITEMPANPFDGVRRIIDGQYSKGHSLYDWYMREWAGVDPANGSALWNLYYDDINGDGAFNVGDQAIDNMVIYLSKNPNAVVNQTTTSDYSKATQKYVGKSAIPKVRGAFRVNAGYKNFDLTAQFSYSVGGYVLDSGYQQLMDNGDLIGTNNWHKDILNAWKQPGDVTDVPRLTSGGLAGDVNQNSTSTRFLTKADYLSLNNLRIGYTLPEKFISKMKLSHVSMYVSGDNLLVFSKRKGLNPTTLISTTNTGIYMPMTTFSFGTKVEF